MVFNLRAIVLGVIVLFSLGLRAQEIPSNTDTEVVSPPPIDHAVEVAPDYIYRTGVEKMAEFPGGTGKMMDYISRVLKYPEEAKEDGIGGRVYLTFVVERDGSLTDIRVLRSAHPSLDNEAVRMVKTMPKWTPGEQNGTACRVQFTLPVTFKLAD